MLWNSAVVGAYFRKHSETLFYIYFPDLPLSFLLIFIHTIFVIVHKGALWFLEREGPMVKIIYVIFFPNVVLHCIDIIAEHRNKQ